jgi:hypothetical protein
MRHFTIILLLAILIGLAFSPVWLPRARGELRLAADNLLACPHCDLM